MYVLSVLLLSSSLPLLYDMIFEKDIPKTHIFYSPTAKSMIYTEQLFYGDKKAAEKSDTHHADVVYKDEAGNYYTREEFEAKIPFIYFRNMEMRGLLPMEIDGKIYDRASIQKARRVLELPARHLDSKRYNQEIYPLIESNPNQVALVYPVDRFRITEDAMEFINSDENAVDNTLTKEFTDALNAQGFVFPAQGVWGNFSIFKPYEAGIFVTDSHGKTYHILRKNNKAVVTKVPFPSDVIPKKIIVSETADRLLYGLMLDTKDRMYILHVDAYKRTHIPVEFYNSENMDFKIIVDPIYITAVYSDDETIYAEAFKNSIESERLEKVHSFSHKMSQSETSLYKHIAQTIFPFSLDLKSEINTKGQIEFSLSPHYFPWVLVFNGLLMIIYSIICKRKKYKISYYQGSAILLLGVYALIPMLLMEQYRTRG